MIDHTCAYKEAGDLGQALAAIMAELDTVRKESEAFNRQLLQRNRELAATAAVAEATSSGQPDLAGTLERALNVVLEFTNLRVGWILLVPNGGGEPVLASSAGISRDVLGKLDKSRPADCACTQVGDFVGARLVYPTHADCPVGALDLGNGRPVTCHATVPLLAHTKLLGVLNLASDEPEAFDEQELTLLGAIGQQLGVAIENAYLWEELQRRDLSRLQLLEQVIAAQEEERRRIARELHDQTGQALTSLLLWLRALEDEADDSCGLTVSLDRLEEFKAIVVDTLDGVRSLALELRPSALDDLGLVPALQRYLRTCHERHDLHIDFQVLGLHTVRLPPLIETALYRIVQEAMTNVVQHADAQQVSLLLAARAGGVLLIVEDDGCGFDVGRLMNGPVDERWLGLSGMRERAELLGGKLTIESTPGAGTTIFVELPLDAAWGHHVE